MDAYKTLGKLSSLFKNTKKTIKLTKLSLQLFSMKEVNIKFEKKK